MKRREITQHESTHQAKGIKIMVWQLFSTLAENGFLSKPLVAIYLVRPWQCKNIVKRFMVALELH